MAFNLIKIHRKQQLEEDDTHWIVVSVVLPGDGEGRSRRMALRPMTALPFTPRSYDTLKFNIKQEFEEVGLFFLRLW